MLKGRGFELYESRAWALKRAKHGLFQTLEAAVVVDADTAIRLLDTQPIDDYVKRDALAKRKTATTGFNCALTALVGDPWVRQRQILVRDVFPLVLGSRPKEIAIKVAEELYARLGAGVVKSGTLDVQATLKPVVCDWILELVLGFTVEETTKNLFLTWWHDHRKFCVGRRTDDGGAFLQHLEHLCSKPSCESVCLMRAMKDAGLAHVEVVSNVLSFLTAGFETTYHITAMTLVMIASKGSASALAVELQQHCAMLRERPELVASNIADLKAIKALAVAGGKIHGVPSPMQRRDRLLALCILETLRKLPPVWTLPRFAGDSCPHLRPGIRTHIDVVCCNGVQKDWPLSTWDPTAPPAGEGHLFTFGVGARSCPAGGAALTASFHWLMVLFSELRMDLDIETLTTLFKTAYLAPTLCFERTFELTAQPVQGALPL